MADNITKTAIVFSGDANHLWSSLSCVPWYADQHPNEDIEIFYNHSVELELSVGPKGASRFTMMTMREPGTMFEAVKKLYGNDSKVKYILASHVAAEALCRVDNVNLCTAYARLLECNAVPQKPLITFHGMNEAGLLRAMLADRNQDHPRNRGSYCLIAIKGIDNQIQFDQVKAARIAKAIYSKHKIYPIVIPEGSNWIKLSQELKPDGFIEPPTNISERLCRLILGAAFVVTRINPVYHISAALGIPTLCYLGEDRQNNMYRYGSDTVYYATRELAIENEGAAADECDGIASYYDIGN